MRLIKFLKLLAPMLVLMFGIGCSVSPEPGHEAVLIKKPWMFGHGGVHSTPVKSGLEWVAFTTDHVMVEMKPQQHEIKFDDLMSSDGVPLDFDSVIRLQVLDSITLVRDFGPNWYKTNVENEFMNRVRQAVRKHGMNETAISCTALDDIDKEVTDAMAAYLVSAKIPVKLIQVTVGKANPPDSVKSQRVETAREQQRILTEGQRKLAEDKRAAAEKARATADNAYRNEMKLSTSEFIELQRINMLYTVGGKGGNTFIIGDVKPVIAAKH